MLNEFAQVLPLRRRGDEVIVVGEDRPSLQREAVMLRQGEERICQERQSLDRLESQELMVRTCGDHVRAGVREAVGWTVRPARWRKWTGRRRIHNVGISCK